MTPSSSAVSWLHEIITQRVHTDCMLSLDRCNSLWILSFPGSSRCLSFPLSPSLYKVSSRNLACTNYIPSSDGFTAIEEFLPAPSLESIPTPFLTSKADSYHLAYDIFGLIYWMLTRCEEVNPPPELLDQHQRFPATSSHAYVHGYLMRPLVDEWIGILRQLVKRAWPSLNLIDTNFQIFVSHDVDSPSAYAFVRKRRFIRVMLADIIKRRNPKSFYAPLVRFHSRRYLHPADPYNTFDWLMDCSERIGIRSSFFFICGRTDILRDAHYDIDYAAIRHLLRHIHNRGHLIGLHPSYNSFQKPEIIVAEARNLRDVCMEEGIDQPSWGGRMHVLRWEWPTTAYGWESAAFDFDSTLSFADHPGFRSGTCHPYRMYDPVSEYALKLIQRPLIAMDCSITDDRYLGLGYGDKAASMFQLLYRNCRLVGGQFNLLWHNSNLVTHKQRQLYTRVLEM